MTARILLLLILCPFFATAQTGGKGWGAFNRVATVKEEWRGKPFRLTATAKANGANEISWAGIWVRVHDVTGAGNFFDNMSDRPVKTDQWTNCEIKSKFKKNDSLIYFGGLFVGPGTYGFDQFSLQIETSPDKWEPAALPGMELAASEDLTAWYMPRDSTGVKYAIADQHLEIDAGNLGVPASPTGRTSTYGANDKAGGYANVNGIKIYYEVYGEGEPLVLLHGNSQAIVVFTDLIPELAKRYKVIAIDTRLQGKSGDDGTRLTYELFAEDVKGVLDHLKLEKVNLFGWSDGGNTGLILAGKYPHRIKTLMTMGANLQPDTASVKPEILNLLAAEIAKLPPEKTREKRLWTLCLEEPHISVEQVKKIKCPTLVMAGDNDMIQDAHTRFIASTIPRGELLIFENATHFAPTEIPVKFREAMETFLQKHR